VNRPPVEIEKRSVSAGTKAKILAAANHVCARPGCEAPATAVDHILPLWLGGSNREKNLEPLCEPHHAAKTASEASLRAKAKRLAGETCTGKSKRPIIRPAAYKWPSRGIGGGPSKKSLRKGEG